MGTEWCVMAATGRKQRIKIYCWYVQQPCQNYSVYIKFKCHICIQTTSINGLCEKKAFWAGKIFQGKPTKGTIDSMRESRETQNVQKKKNRTVWFLDTRLRKDLIWDNCSDVREFSLWTVSEHIFRQELTDRNLNTIMLRSKRLSLSTKTLE